MASDFDPGLLGMNLSDSDSDQENSTPTPAEGAANSTTRADRTALSEEAFQLLKATYRPKVENGEIWSTIDVPVGNSKPETQELLHAAEELYFFRRYDEAVRFVQRVFSEEEGNGEARLDADTKRLLRYYEAKSKERLAGLQISGVTSKAENTT